MSTMSALRGLEVYEREAGPGAPQTCGHLVQLYGTDASPLAKNVGRFLREGIERGDSLIVIASPENSAAFVAELSRFGLNPARLIASSRFVLLDAVETLERFTTDGYPDADLFEAVVGRRVSEMRESSASGEVSAYGEMVGVLWTRGCFSAAMALEDLWNQLLATNKSRLFCGYPIDVFGNKFHSCDVDALMCSHTHFIAAEANDLLEASVLRAIRETLGYDEELQRRLEQDMTAEWAGTLRGEALILSLRKNLNQRADPIISRARQHYESRRNPV